MFIVWPKISLMAEALKQGFPLYCAWILYTVGNREVGVQELRCGIFESLQLECHFWLMSGVSHEFKQCKIFFNDPIAKTH